MSDNDSTLDLDPEILALNGLAVSSSHSHSFNNDDVVVIKPPTNEVPFNSQVANFVKEQQRIESILAKGAKSDAGMLARKATSDSKEEVTQEEDLGSAVPRTASVKQAAAGKAVTPSENNNSRIRPKTCHICGDAGHLVKKCPKKGTRKTFKTSAPKTSEVKLIEAVKDAESMAKGAEDAFQEMRKDVEADKKIHPALKELNMTDEGINIRAKHDYDTSLESLEMFKVKEYWRDMPVKDLGRCSRAVSVFSIVAVCIAYQTAKVSAFLSTGIAGTIVDKFMQFVPLDLFESISTPLIKFAAKLTFGVRSLLPDQSILKNSKFAVLFVAIALMMRKTEGDRFNSFAHAVKSVVRSDLICPPACQAVKRKYSFVDDAIGYDVPLVDLRADVSSLAEIRHTNPMFAYVAVTDYVFVRSPVDGYFRFLKSVLVEHLHAINAIASSRLEEPELLTQQFREPRNCQCARFDFEKTDPVTHQVSCDCLRSFPTTIREVDEGRFMVSLELIQQLLGGKAINNRLSDSELRTEFLSRAGRTHTINICRNANALNALIANSVEMAIVIARKHIKDMSSNFVLDAADPPRFSV